ncbi:MAG: hypothetical protein V4637_20985 [Pseudomonadota bacterium]
MNTVVLLAESSARAAARKWVGAIALQLGILLCGVMLSLWLCYLALQRNAFQDELQFQEEVQGAVAALQSRIQSNASQLSEARAM